MDRETVKAITEIIAMRSRVLIEQSKISERWHENDRAQELSMRAWELEMVIQDIERKVKEAA